MKHNILFFFLFLLMSSASAQLFKISQEGVVVGGTSSDYRCVLDNKTNLLWEVKLDSIGLQNTKNTYTWFDGRSGVANGDYSHNCHWSKSCNTQAYVDAIKNSKLCKQKKWRLPTESELRTLLVYGDEDLLINQDFFKNTQLKSYWSSDQVNGDIAIDVPFFYGGSKGSDKSFDAYVRLVSDAN